MAALIDCLYKQNFGHPYFYMVPPAWSQNKAPITVVVVIEADGMTTLNTSDQSVQKVLIVIGDFHNTARFGFSVHVSVAVGFVCGLDTDNITTGGIGLQVLAVELVLR